MTRVLFVDCPESYEGALPPGALAMQLDTLRAGPTRPDLIVIGPASPKPTVSAQHAAHLYPGVDLLITAPENSLERLRELLAITPSVPLSTELVAAELAEEALRSAIQRCELRKQHRRVLATAQQALTRSLQEASAIPPLRPLRGPPSFARGRSRNVHRGTQRFLAYYWGIRRGLTRDVRKRTWHVDAAYWPLRQCEANADLDPQKLEEELSKGRPKAYLRALAKVGKAHAEAGLGFGEWLQIAHHFRRSATDRYLAQWQDKELKEFLRGMEAFLHTTLVGLEQAHARALAERTKRYQTKAELFAVAVESSDEAILTTTLDGEITAQNSAAERLYGHTTEQALGTSFLERASSAHRAQLESLLANARAGKPARRMEIELMDRREKRLAIELSISPVRGTHKVPVGLSIISRDLSEQRRAEAALRQSQKMEALGRLAGGIAHDFNNLLTVILTHASFLQESLQQERPSLASSDTESLNDLLSAAERARSLAAQLLTFSRRQPLRPSVLSLKDEVIASHNMLRRTFPTNIEVVVLMPEGLWPVYIDPVQFDQLLMNLALNGRDAMPNGGRLTIELSNRRFERARGGLPAGDYVVLEVTDAGTGISREALAEVFDPFFTTKNSGSGGGTGLGLATCLSVCRQAGGDISVSSELGQGTTFTAILPRAASSDDTVVRVNPQPGKRELSGRETVVVAEDDPAVRLTLCTALTRYGYQVIEAESGDVALRKILAHQGPVDLLLTDMIMPQMSGPELAEHISKERPEVAIVFITGYANEESMGRYRLGKGAELLLKPFTPSDLLRKVREILDGRSGSGALDQEGA